MIEELRTQIETTQHNLRLAIESDLPHEASLHRARLADLLDRAARYGVEVAPWVDRTLLSESTAAEGESK